MLGCWLRNILNLISLQSKLTEKVHPILKLNHNAVYPYAIPTASISTALCPCFRLVFLNWFLVRWFSFLPLKFPWRLYSIAHGVNWKWDAKNGFYWNDANWLKSNFWLTSILHNVKFAVHPMPFEWFPSFAIIHWFSHLNQRWTIECAQPPLSIHSVRIPVQ